MWTRQNDVTTEDTEQTEARTEDFTTESHGVTRRMHFGSTPCSSVRLSGSTLPIAAVAFPEWLSSAGTNLSPILLDAALKGVALLALTALVTLAMRRSSAAARHLIWFLGIVSLLILPILSATLPAWHILPGWTLPTAAAQVTPVPPTAIPLGSQVPPVPPLAVLPAPQPDLSPAPSLGPVPSPADLPTQPAPSSPSSLRRSVAASLFASPSYLLLIWLTGTTLLLIKLLFAFLALRWLEHRSSPLADPSWSSLLQKLSRDLHLRRPVVLLTHPAKTMPMTWGLWKTRLLLPQDSATSTWPADQRRAVLLHELAHARRWDCLTQLITQLACALYWFNPLIWLAWHRMQTERECASDDVVLSTGAKASAYAQQLLHIASEMPTLRFSAAAIAMARPSSLEGRLLAILDVTRNRRTLTWTAGLLAVLLIVAFAVPIAMLRAETRGAAEVASSLTPGEIDRQHAVFTGQLAPSQQLILQVGAAAQAPAWRSSGPGDFTAVFEPSEQIPLSSGKLGHGFVFTVSTVGGASKVNVAFSKGGPVPDGKLTLRDRATIVNNHGVITFADIKQDDGKTIPISLRTQTAIDDRQTIQGTWDCVSAIQGGQPSSDEAQMRQMKMLIDEKEFKSMLGEQVVTRSTYTLDPQRQPKTLDLRDIQYPQSPILGIYELDGDTLRICQGPTRPTQFASQSGSPNSILYVLRRAKPATQPAHTVTYHAIVQTPGNPDQTSKVMVKDRSDRTEMPDGKVLIRNAIEGKGMFLDPEHKTATISTLEDIPPGGPGPDIEKLADPGSYPTVSLGRKQIAGREADGIQFNINGQLRIVWRDPASRRPLQIDITVIPNPYTAQPICTTYSDIAFGVPFADSLFAIQPPPGYERKEGTRVRWESVQLPASQPATQLPPPQYPSIEQVVQLDKTAQSQVFFLDIESGKVLASRPLSEPAKTDAAEAVKESLARQPELAQAVQQMGADIAFILHSGKWVMLGLVKPGFIETTDAFYKDPQAGTAAIEGLPQALQGKLKWEEIGAPELTPAGWPRGVSRAHVLLVSGSPYFDAGYADGCYWIHTAQGSLAVVQLGGVGQDVPAVRFRYKVLHSLVTATPDTQPTATQPADRPATHSAADDPVKLKQAYEDYTNENLPNAQAVGKFEGYLTQHPDTLFKAEIFFRLGCMYSMHVKEKFNEKPDVQKMDGYFQKAHAIWGRHFSNNNMIAWGTLANRSTDIQAKIDHYQWLLDCPSATAKDVYPIRDIAQTFNGRPAELTAAEKATIIDFYLKANHKAELASTEDGFLSLCAKSPSALATLAKAFPQQRLGAEAAKLLAAHPATQPAQASTVGDILASLKSELVKISKDYPELTGIADTQLQQDAQTGIWSLAFFHNCKDQGKRGYEDTGPNPAAVTFRITTAARYQWELTNTEMQMPLRAVRNRQFIVYDRLYFGKAPTTPGFESAVRALLEKHVAMVDALERAMPASASAPASPMDPNKEWVPGQKAFVDQLRAETYVQSLTMMADFDSNYLNGGNSEPLPTLPESTRRILSTRRFAKLMDDTAGAQWPPRRAQTLDFLNADIAHWTRLYQQGQRPNKGTILFSKPGTDPAELIVPLMYRMNATILLIAQHPEPSSLPSVVQYAQSLGEHANLAVAALAADRIMSLTDLSSWNPAQRKIVEQYQTWKKTPEAKAFIAYTTMEFPSYRELRRPQLHPNTTDVPPNTESPADNIAIITPHMYSVHVTQDASARPTYSDGGTGKTALAKAIVDFAQQVALAGKQ